MGQRERNGGEKPSETRDGMGGRRVRRSGCRGDSVGELGDGGIRGHGIGRICE